MSLNALDVVTLFVDRLDEANAFYLKVFEPQMIYEDAVSAVMDFSGVMINLLAVTEAPELVEPMTVAPKGPCVQSLLTIKVDDVDAVCDRLHGLGVTLLNGPLDRPWGRRTAAFADSSGHVGKVAQVLG